MFERLFKGFACTEVFIGVGLAFLVFVTMDSPYIKRTISWKLHELVRRTNRCLASVFFFLHKCGIAGTPYLNSSAAIIRSLLDFDRFFVNTTIFSPFVFLADGTRIPPKPAS